MWAAEVVLLLVAAAPAVVAVLEPPAAVAADMAQSGRAACGPTAMHMWAGCGLGWTCI
jgi:hypothetical protein